MFSLSRLLKVVFLISEGGSQQGWLMLTLISSSPSPRIPYIYIYIYIYRFTINCSALSEKKITPGFIHHNNFFYDLAARLIEHLSED